jgi:hypothetical protein
MKLVLVILSLCATLCLSSPVPHDTPEIVTYNQQQHATGHNVRVNLNKILIAILPLEEAIVGLSALDGPSYEDFGDITFADLKPPSTETTDPELEEPEEAPAENSSSSTSSPENNPSSTTVTETNEATPTPTTKVLQPSSQVIVARKPIRRPIVERDSCTPAEASQGRCSPHRR